MIQRQFLIFGRETNEWFYTSVSYLCSGSNSESDLGARIVA